MQNVDFSFTYKRLYDHFETIINSDYKILTCKEYVDIKQGKEHQKILVNRVDIDGSCKKALRIAQIFNDLGIKGTFFVRLHGKEYNPFSFENYLCLKFIRDSGHEIGYHSEVVDQSVIWNENVEMCLRRDITVLETMMEIKVLGVASHGGMTGLNNLDFWKNRKAKDFGLLYEAYDTQPEFGLFNTSFYISDSEWTRWKCYQNGVLCSGDNRNPSEHVLDEHPLIYLLIHPDSYFDRHFYE